jgi:hypothetical protein
MKPSANRDADERVADVQQVARLAVDVPDDEDRHGDGIAASSPATQLVAQVGLEASHGPRLDAETARTAKIQRADVMTRARNSRPCRDQPTGSSRPHHHGVAIPAISVAPEVRRRWLTGMVSPHPQLHDCQTACRSRKRTVVDHAPVQRTRISGRPAGVS